MSATREIRLPALSATMEEATLLAWKVAVGDTVKEGQAIAEVSTDKVDMDLESPFDGVIESLAVEPGQAVPIGAIVAVAHTESRALFGDLTLDADDETGESGGETGESGGETGGQVSGPSREGGPIVAASPPARKMAREMGVDLSAVIPTGARGQVTPADVKKHADTRVGATPAPPKQRPPHPEAADPEAADPEAADPEAAPGAAPEAAPQARPGAAPSVGDEARRSAVRRATVEVMTRSAAIPQFTLYRTLVLDRAQASRAGRSWTTVLVRALAGALRGHPELTARWDDDARAPLPVGSIPVGSIPVGTIAVGLAVDRPGVGLVVATISDPDVGDPGEVDRAVRMVADRAKTGKLRPEDMAQASITLSNLGGLGVDRFNALLFPPQAAILSAGSIEMRPIATSDGALKAALTCEVGLTVDHRVADGADGARFLDTFANLVEGH